MLEQFHVERKTAYDRRDTVYEFRIRDGRKGPVLASGHGFVSARHLEEAIVVAMRRLREGILARP